MNKELLQKIQDEAERRYPELTLSEYHQLPEPLAREYNSRGEKFIEAATFGLSLQASANEWVKCSERMPTKEDADEFNEVWVWDSYQKVGLKVRYGCVKNLEDFTHWMPLPQKPKD